MSEIPGPLAEWGDDFGLTAARRESSEIEALTRTISAVVVDTRSNVPLTISEAWPALAQIIAQNIYANGYRLGSQSI